MQTEILPNCQLETTSLSLRQSSRSAILWISVLALLTRGLTLLFYLKSHPWTWFYGHPGEMGLLADSLLHGLGYSSPFGTPTGPTAFIAPGYPTIVAAVFLIFGGFSHTSVVVLIAMNIGFTLCTIGLMMHIARKVFDERTAVLAGAFWALSLPLFWMPEIFWESALSECAVIGMIALALHYRDAPTRGHWVLFGSLAAVVALINPALLPSLLAILGWLAWQTRRTSRTAPLLGMLALTLVFAPWPIRNAVRFHAFIPLRSTVGFEMWMGNRPGANGRLDESIFPSLNRHELDSYLAQGEVAYTSGKNALAWQYIRANPGVFVRMTARRVWRFWAGTGNIDTTHTCETHALLTTVFGFTGLVLAYRRRMRDFAVLMALPLVLFPIPYYITHAEFRYRLNIDPVLTVLAAYAVTQIFAALSRRRSETPVSDAVRAVSS